MLGKSSDRSRFRPFCKPMAWLSSALFFPLLLGFVPMAAIAQVAETPRTDASGNYSTASVQGNRGNYPNKKWLVVDSTPLNCRTSPNGDVRSTVAPGALLTAEFVDREAIVNQSGSSWLRVTGTDPLTYAVRRRNGSLGTCFVRANQRFIAPVNTESLQLFLQNDESPSEILNWD